MPSVFLRQSDPFLKNDCWRAAPVSYMGSEALMKSPLFIAAIVTGLCSVHCAGQGKQDAPQDQPVPVAPVLHWPPPPLPAAAVTPPAASAAADFSEEENTVRHVTVKLLDGSLLVGTMPADTSFPIQASQSKLNIAIKRVDAITFSDDRKQVVIDMQNGDQVTGVLAAGSLPLKLLFGNIALDTRYIESVNVRGIEEPELVFRDALGRGRMELLNIPATIGNKESIVTKASFKPPLEITVIAKTNSTDLRIWYTAGVIFNWEQDARQLRIDGGDRNMGKGGIPAGKYVTIRWLVTPHGQKIYVDGELRIEDHEDYSHIYSPVAVYQYGNSAVTVKSIRIKPL
jgi:hypothetical protein